MRPEPRLETEKTGKLDAPVSREEARGMARVRLAPRQKAEESFPPQHSIRDPSPRRRMFVQAEQRYLRKSTAGARTPAPRGHH